MRFVWISDEDLLSFVQEQENVNMKKTDSNPSLFREVRSVGENFQNFDPAELYLHVASFIVNVKRQDSHDYETATVREFESFIDLYLRQSRYPYSILKSLEFFTSRDALKAKQARASY